MGEKPKAYVLCTKTFREIESIAANSQEYRIDLYSLEIDRSDLSEEQKKIQNKNHWYANEDVDLRIWGAKLDELVSKKIMNAVLSKCDGNILEKTADEIMDVEVRFLGKTSKDKNKTRITMDFEVGDDRNDMFEYSDDLEEFKEKAKKSTRNTSYSNDGEVVYLEKVSAGIYKHAFENFKKDVKKEINKFVRNKLTYCLKNGECIVPDEYIAKGEKGIEEWRNIKSSKNKNNSIEKKLLRDVVRDKKDYAYDCVFIAMDKILYRTNNNYDWSIPRLMIDGKYNKQRTAKLATKILGTKNTQEIIDMPKETILENAKKYWKEILMDAYNNVDKMEVPDKR